MEKILKELGKEEFKLYFNDYENTNDYNFTKTELEELEEFSIENDFIYFTLIEISKTSMNLNKLFSELDFTKELQELLKGITKKQLYLNWNIFENIIIAHYKTLEEKNKLYNFN